MLSCIPSTAAVAMAVFPLTRLAAGYITKIVVLLITVIIGGMDMNMPTIIVGLVFCVALYFALKGVVKHWQGEGSCCGGDGGVVAPPPKKLQGTIIGKKIIKIKGMTCGHCKIRVEEMLNSLEGAAAVVNLHRDEALLSMTREVSDDEIRAAMKGGDYEIIRIEKE